MNILNTLLKFNAKLNLFEYGIPVNGIIRDVDSAGSYARNYKYLSPNEFKKYNGGICWDYVAYQSDFLSKHNIPFKNYFIWNPKKIDEEGTHTLTIVFDNKSNKYYYIESSFKPICGVYESDNYEDILEFVIQNMRLTQYEIYSYEFCEIYGASTLQYMEWMIENAKLEKRGKPNKNKIYLKNYQNPLIFPKDERTEQESVLESFIEYCNDMKISDTLEIQNSHISISKLKSIINKIKTKVKSDSKEPTGNQNCMLCTWCLEAQIRGINVFPRPVYSPRDIIFTFEGYSIVMLPTKIKIVNKNDVVDKVMKAGDGARFYTHVNWKNSSGGHEFIIINIKNKIYVLDAQSGTCADIKSKDGAYYFNDINYKNSFLVRIDDKNLNKDILKYNNDSYILEWNEEKDIPYLEEEN